jgi:HSP20 family protein
VANKSVKAADRGSTAEPRHMARIRSLKLRWLQGQLTELAWEHTRRMMQFPRSAVWQPAINAFCCDRAYCVCVDLAGVQKEEIELIVEPGFMRIRGTRTSPLPASIHGKPVRVLALEIDSGDFEREMQLPPEVDLRHITAEQENGLLWIRLPIP